MDEAPETTGAPGPEEVPAQAEAEAASVDAAARVDTDAPPAPTVDSTATAEPALTGEVPPPLQLAVDAAPPAPELPRARIPAPAAPAAEFAAAPVKRPQLSPSATQPAADEPAELPFDAPRAGLYQITFTLQPDGYTHKGEYAPNMTLGEVAVALDNELHIPAQSLVFSLHGRQLPHSTRLSDHGLSLDVPNALSMAVQVGVQKPAPTDYVMPDVITVEVTFEDAPPRVIHVPVERDLPMRGKPFLGGFRHKQTGVEFHHASSQSMPAPKRVDDGAPPPIVRNHRDTQTAVVVTRSQQAVREQGTQMTKLGVEVDPAADRLLRPMPYFSSDDYDLLRLEKAIDLQRYTRGFFARSRAAELIALAARREVELRAADDARRAEAEARHRREVERRMNPRTYDDFETLFNELEAWRLSESAKINDPATGLDEAERSAARAQLLQREQKLLQTIDRLRLQAAEANRNRTISGTLARMAAPKRWQLSDGELVEVHTPYTTRAKELHELYNGLRLPLLSIDERLDVLLHVKWTVKEFDCNLTRDIVDLIDREADMLNRGRSEESLEGLRKRLANLFLQFVHTPEFNPEAARFQQVPLELTTLHPAMGGSGIAA